MALNGSGADERIDVSADGERVRFVRDVAAVTMNLDGVWRIDTAALGGADRVTVGDLSGTAVTELDTELAATPDGAVADAAIDRMVVRGTDGDDAVEALGQAGNTAVVGLPALVRVRHADPTDSLAIDALAGDGADAVDGDRGDDLALLGAGDDLFTWDRARARTPSRGRTDWTGWRSTAPARARTSTSRPSAGARGSSATSAP